MEAEGVSRKFDKGVRKNIQSRRIWSFKEEETLVNELKDIVLKGWKCENGFKTGYLMLLETRIRQKFSGTDLRAEPHINSKVHVWKKNHGSLMTMLSRSGFEWNDTSNTVNAEDDVWEKYIKVDPNAKALRFKPFPFFKAWVEIFGKDKETGEDAQDFDSVVQESSTKGKEKESESIDIFDDEMSHGEVGDGEENSSNTQTRDNASGKKTSSKKRKLQDSHDRFLDMMVDYRNTTDSRLAEISKRIGYEHDASDARREVYGALGKIPGLSTSNKILVAKRIVNNHKDLDLFFSMPDGDRAEMVRMMLMGEI